MRSIISRALVPAAILFASAVTPAHAAVVNYDIVLDLNDIAAVDQGFSYYQIPAVTLATGDELVASVKFADGQSLRYDPASPSSIFVGALYSGIPDLSIMGPSYAKLTGLTGYFNGVNGFTGRYYGSIVFASVFGTNSDFQFTGIDFSATWTGPAFSSDALALQQTVQIMNSTPAVPEPATWAMMLVGFGAIGCATRRRRQDVALRFSPM